MTIMKKFAMLAVVAAMGAVTTAQAATYTWIGGMNPDWNNSARWSSSNGGTDYPGFAAGDTAIFTSNATITSGIPSTALTALTVQNSAVVSLNTSVSASAGAVTIASGAQLTLGSNLSFAMNSSASVVGTLILASGADFTANASVSNTGTLTVSSGAVMHIVAPASITNSGTLNMYGTFEVLGNGNVACDIDAGQVINDSSSSYWFVNGTTDTKLTFNEDYSLSGDFALNPNFAQSRIEIAAGKTVVTAGDFDKGAQSTSCDGILTGASAAFEWDGGNNPGVCPP